MRTYQEYRKGSWLLGAGVMVLISASQLAAQTYTMELTGPPPGPSLGGVYISPYTALIGPPGQTQPPITGVSTSVICDDFTTDVSTGTPPWQAIATNLAFLQGETSADTNLKFDQTNAAQQQTDYTVAALLSTEILQSQAANNVTAEGELSFALWGLFDPTSIDPNGPLSGNWINGATLTAANNYLTQARNQVASNSLTPASYSNVTIYSPTPQSASQEYIVVSMPEPSELATLAFDIAGVLALVLFLKRRASRSLS